MNIRELKKKKIHQKQQMKITHIQQNPIYLSQMTENNNSNYEKVHNSIQNLCKCIQLLIHYPVVFLSLVSLLVFVVPCSDVQIHQ